MVPDKKSKKTMIQVVMLVAVLALAFCGLWILAEYIKEEQNVDALHSEITVSMIIEKDGEWTIEYLNVDTFNNTVYKLLLECSRKNNFFIDSIQWKGYDSVFINAINGTENGEGGNWWQYYVNDVYGDVGCDRKEIFDGDVVKWLFEEPGQ